MRTYEDFEGYAIEARAADDPDPNFVEFEVIAGENEMRGIFLSGSVKFDGCSNWDFHTDDTLMHFCDQAEAEGLGRLLGRLYQIARERLAVPAS